jgi:general secretion pathway protein J
MEARRELASTLDLIRREVASSLYNRGDKRLRFVVEDRDNFGKPASTLELTTVSDRLAGVPDSGVRVVGYRLVEKGKRPLLQRREQDFFFEKADAPGYPQMERISAFLVECHDGTKWVRSWDTALNGTTPKMVRVTVTVEEEGRPQEFSVLAPVRVTGS